MSIIRIESLTVRYGHRRGVENVSLGVPEGSLFGFLGPNGAGKTTTIRALLGLLRPTSGRATIFGRDCWRDGRRIKRDLGAIPGDLRLYPWLTGHAAVRLFGAIRGVDLRPGAKDLAELFRLDLGIKVRAMSRGTRQKLGLVLALAHGPRALILDEPTSGLDPLVQDALMERLREMRRRGHTVLFSSHTLAEVERLCDRVAIVREGALVADETLEELRAQAGRQVVVRWGGAAPVPESAPAFFEVDRRSATEWVGLVRGPIAPLLEWLASPMALSAVADVSISEPDLEAVFRRFYRARGAQGAGA